MGFADGIGREAGLLQMLVCIALGEAFAAVGFSMWSMDEDRWNALIVFFVSQVLIFLRIVQGLICGDVFTCSLAFSGGSVV